MTFDFVEFPTEILLNITSYLTTPDYCSLRRTCSNIEKKLFDSFAREFFTRKQFMLTYTSLQALIDISNHKALSGYLKKIIIGTDTIPLHIPAFNSHGTPLITFSATDSWRREILDQQYLVRHGSDVSMLSEAFMKLENCCEIEIRDYNSRTRYRDSGFWTSYGAPTFFQKAGTRTNMVSDTTGLRQPWAPKVFSTVLEAIVESKAAFKSLMMTTREPGNGLDLSAFYIPPRFESRYMNGLKSITTLMLSIEVRRNQPFSISPTEFESFLRLMPNLTWLRLNFDLISDKSMYVRWLDAAQTTLESVPLRRLELGKFDADVDKICEFISTFKQTVEELVFFRVGVHDGSWIDILNHLEQLAALQYVEFGMIRQKNYRVSFKDPADPTSKPADITQLKPGASRKASCVVDMKGKLDELKALLVVIDEAFQRRARGQDSDVEMNEDESEDTEDNSEDYPEEEDDAEDE